MINDFILVKENFLPKEWCDNAIDFFEKTASMGLGYNRAYQADSALKMQDKSISTADVARGYPYLYAQNEFCNAFWATAYREYADQFASLKESGSHAIYTVKIQKTEPGEGYHIWHYESSDRESAQRILTFVFYLNDVDEGGETEFLYQKKRVKPKAGTLVLFPAGFTHVHRGNPPLSGSKYIMTGWVEF